MNFNADIAESTLAKSVREHLLLSANQATQAADKLARLEQKLKHAELKIQALTLALAHHKRLRFGVKSESLPAAQRELFAEDWQGDNGELELAVESVNSPSRAPRSNAGRQPLPDCISTPQEFP